MKNLVIYHANCLDGFGAAFSAWTRFGHEAVYIPSYYGDTPPNAEGKRVYILDFSYPVEVLKEIISKAEKVVLLDHHKSALKLLEDPEVAKHCTINMDHSGAYLAWEYFQPTTLVPEMIAMIEDRDLWRFKIPESKAFNARLWTEGFDFRAWDKVNSLSRVKLKEFIKEGEVLLKDQKMKVDELLKMAELINFDGFSGAIVNANSFFASDVGNRLAQVGFDFGATWFFDGKKFHVSLRSIGEMDVSKIAANRGGGGHRNAAGFTTDSLEFLR